MTADGWTKAVRRQLGPGRVLPLGGPRDGAWITERAAESVLRRAAAGLRGIGLGTLRISVADPDGQEAAVPPPPSALPSGSLRVTADFAALADLAAEPFPASAARLRGVLATAAEAELGLRVAEVDLRLTRLLDGDERAVSPAPAGPAAAPPDPPVPTGDVEQTRAAVAGLSVPGVSGLATVLGAAGTTAPVLPRRHVLVDLTVTQERRTLDVAREVRAAVGASLPDHPSVAVLVTAVTSGVALV
ncbi:nucleopolyhedrovirus P10 family protein [Streptomyces scabiei]|uniref:nucleopolyhedrovirus P10 family protein n=1 Tax=Streptomyces scabiei TaxID=1930 RepID=UPI00299033EA|nr:nucleopolyhedrovirus P10 family protein [Streptomyces scabiei]MDW8805581.1 nucleopolyhedrovirus P10 family protein [Streptomyces scabiei]